jgi:formate hydrogenlyase transcriptional activator
VGLEESGAADHSRRDDIPKLILHFVEKCATRLNMRIDIIPDQVIDAMMQWSWPGNIRELENFIERSVILSEGNRLCAPLGELRAAMPHQPSDIDVTLRDRERAHIVDILRLTRGALSGPTGAAARLGLKRTTLQYKMQRLGISRTDYLR